MNLKRYVYSLTTALLLASAMLLSAMPAFAAQDTAADSAATDVLAASPDLPSAAPPPPSPEPPDNAYTARPRLITQPLPQPTPTPQLPDNAYTPRPRPTPTPRPTPQPTQPDYSNYGYYRWYNNTPVYNAPVIIYQQTQVTSYVPVVEMFSADVNYVQPGQSSTLNWTVSNADTITITPSIGTVAATGSMTVIPDYTTTYTLTAGNGRGQVSASTTVTVAPYVYSYSPTGTGPGTTAAAATTVPGNSVNTSGLNSLAASLSPWMWSILLLCLLALASAVAVYLMVRKPAAAQAPARAARTTVYSATATAPAATMPASTTMPVATAVVQGRTASLVSPAGTALQLNAGPLGRRDFAELAQPDKAGLISRQHLLVTYEDDRYVIEDLNSTNGTRLNGAEIRGRGKQTIENGDTIELPGSLKLTFKS